MGEASADNGHDLALRRVDALETLKTGTWRESHWAGKDIRTLSVDTTSGSHNESDIRDALLKALRQCGYGPDDLTSSQTRNGRRLTAYSIPADALPKVLDSLDTLDWTPLPQTPAKTPERESVVHTTARDIEQEIGKRLGAKGYDWSASIGRRRSSGSHQR